MAKNDWLEIKNQLRRVHPVMDKRLNAFEDTLGKALNAAKLCDPEGVHLAIEACKLSVELCNDIDHLKAVGIIGRDGFRDGIETYSTDQFHQIFIEYSACLGKDVEAQIMTKLIEGASELEPKWLARLVGFAQEIREMDRDRQSSG